MCKSLRNTGLAHQFQYEMPDSFECCQSSATSFKVVFFWTYSEVDTGTLLGVELDSEGMINLRRSLRKCQRQLLWSLSLLNAMVTLFIECNGRSFCWAQWSPSLLNAMVALFIELHGRPLYWTPWSPSLLNAMVALFVERNGRPLYWTQYAPNESACFLRGKLASTESRHPAKMNPQLDFFLFFFFASFAMNFFLLLLCWRRFSSTRGLGLLFLFVCLFVFGYFWWCVSLSASVCVCVVRRSRHLASSLQWRGWGLIPKSGSEPTSSRSWIQSAKTTRPRLLLLSCFTNVKPDLQSSIHK